MGSGATKFGDSSADVPITRVFGNRTIAGMVSQAVDRDTERSCVVKEIAQLSHPHVVRHGSQHREFPDRVHRGAAFVVSASEKSPANVCLSLDPAVIAEGIGASNKTAGFKWNVGNPEQPYKTTLPVFLDGLLTISADCSKQADDKETKASLIRHTRTVLQRFPDTKIRFHVQSNKTCNKRSTCR
eukprot:TRINITY_DN1704_c5_g1_i1.p1 TRINITY_DN1704_c5_g1~~TRINITY_DN1704_c5_g1_i1.p1  ORF type:complete len:192 (+),score=25.98 TRINITY_DN1704_c5_g1_i1:23-577(+)